MNSKYQGFQNGSLLFRQSFYWFCAALLLIFEIIILKGFIFRSVTKKCIPDILLFPIEYSFLALSTINALYCLFSYLHSIYQSFVQHLYGHKSQQKNRRDLDESLRADCVKSLYSFMSNFFKLSTQPPYSKEANISLSSTSSANIKNNSMSSLIGFHDSPLNKTVTSIHSRSQLDEIIANENCDTVVDPSDCTAFFTRDYGEISQYIPGTIQYTTAPKMSNAMEGIQSFYSVTRSEYEPRAERRLYHRTFSTSADSSPKVHIETNVKEILRFYDLDETKLEAYELKLRIWMCNTIVRPLLEKIDELNKMLAEKYTNLHVRIGHSALDAIQTHKVELCNTWLPFLLPYIRIHSNQGYLVNRIRSLAQNIALEDFKWNCGEDTLVRDENNEFNRISTWTNQLPSDPELIWHFFCTYMDFHLSPSSEAVAAVNEFSKPFSNIYSVKSLLAGDFPLALKAKRDQQKLQGQPFDESFFIRIASTNPPSFEMVVDGGETVMLPLKDTQHNFWLTLIIFLAHIKKVANERIGHVNLESLSLNIFDL